MTTDLPFFTNEPDATLLDRFRIMLDDAQGNGPRVVAWESELNTIIYRLYDLTAEEIALVEETVRGE